MEGRERDTTQDWVIPEGSTPPSLGELQERIDEALITAREAEAAVEYIGDVALDAAEQSREAAVQACRAAELAERASAAMLEGQADSREATRDTKLAAAAEPVSEGMQSFTERADRIAARLREL